MEKKLLPVLRSDLQLHTYTQDNMLFVVLSDPYGYAEGTKTLHVNAYNLLVNFAVEMTEQELLDIFKAEGAEDGIIEQFMKLIQLLDDDGFMLSEKFVTMKTKKDMEYLALPERPEICAGDSYPGKPEEIIPVLDKLFSTAPKDKFSGAAKAVVIPHLDLRLGGELDYAYSAGYRAIEQSNADVFVIIGTSHFISNDYFMFSEKPYRTPLGSVTTDMELLQAIDDELGDYMTIDDLAHKNEHSIEYQVLLLQHFFGKDIKILPILAGSLFDEMEQNDSEIKSTRYNKVIKGMRKAIEKLGRKPVFIASADLAHVGRKFGDDFDADTKLEEIEAKDLKMIDRLVAESGKGFLTDIFECNDERKVCGTSSITAITKLCDYDKAKLLHYNIWNEEETKSAVSFASIKFE